MIKEIQQLLQLNGLYTGTIDGAFGLSSLRAVNNMPKAVAQAMQKLLQDAGLYKGAIDGVFGPASYQALNSLIPAPKITAVALQKIYPKASSQFLQYINTHAESFGITTKAQMCMFLANVLVESIGFNDKDLRENFNYRPETLYNTFHKYIASVDDARKLIAQGPEAIANRVYGGRMGNGKTNGDGWRYRGGGLIQTTGYLNYSAVGKGIKEDLVNFPSKIAEPEIAVKSALYYWMNNRCGYYADRMQVKDCRKAINGGTNGLDDVNEYFLKSWAYLF